MFGPTASVLLGCSLVHAQDCCDVHANQPTVPQGFANCGGDRPTGLPFAKRSPVIARNGVAASSHPLVTQVALQVMREGGNALDAAVAANAAQGLMEPMSNGIGGDLFAIVWDPATKKGVVRPDSYGQQALSILFWEHMAVGTTPAK
eukprot:gene6224-1111_t